MPPISQPRTAVHVLDATALDARLTGIETMLLAILESRHEPKPVLLDRSGLAVALNLSTKSLDKLRGLPGFPELTLLDSPRFELDRVLEWLRVRDSRLRVVGGSRESI